MRPVERRPFSLGVLPKAFHPLEQDRVLAHPAPESGAAKLAMETETRPGGVGGDLPIPEHQRRADEQQTMEAG
jgi:hypothetical protein